MSLLRGYFWGGYCHPGPHEQMRIKKNTNKIFTYLQVIITYIQVTYLQVIIYLHIYNKIFHIYKLFFNHVCDILFSLAIFPV